MSSRSVGGARTAQTNNTQNPFANEHRRESYDRETQASLGATPRTALTFSEDPSTCQDSLKKLLTKTPPTGTRFSRSSARDKDLNRSGAFHFLFCRRLTTVAK